MAKKKGTGFFTTVKNLIQAHIQRVVDLASLANLEAQLAKRTFITLLTYGVILLILGGSSLLWLSLSIFFSLVHFGISYLISAILVFALHILFVLGISLYISKIKQNLTFPSTRKQLSYLWGNYKELK